MLPFFNSTGTQIDAEEKLPLLSRVSLENIDIILGRSEKKNVYYPEEDLHVGRPRRDSRFLFTAASVTASRET